MSNLSQNKSEKIAKVRHIKNHRNMSREELLISLSKSKQSVAELRKSKDNNVEIEETKKSFNELRNRFSKEKKKKESEKNFILEKVLASI